MPYLRPDARRGELDAGAAPVEAGELNYVITRAVQAFLRQGKETYARYNAAIGALECAKQELYRRKIVPYEDGKIQENGDVYRGQ